MKYRYQSLHGLCNIFFFIWDPKLSTLTFLSSQPSVNAKCFIPIAKGTSAHQADHFSEGWPKFSFATILQYYFHVFQISTYNLHKIIFASQGLRGKYMNQKPLVNEDEDGIKLINMH